jgi:hypothetical protein
LLACGRIVHPSTDASPFLRALPKSAGWYGIEKGRDFLKAQGHWYPAFGDRPFARLRDFLRKAMEVTDNAPFIALAPAWLVRARRDQPPLQRRQAGRETAGGSRSPVFQ